jgi:hypothetical protein
MGPGYPLILLAGDVEVLEQGLQPIPKAQMAERIQGDRQPDQHGQQDPFPPAADRKPPVSIPWGHPPDRRGPEQIDPPEVEPVQPPV